MHGLVDIITVVMAIEEIKKNILSFFTSDDNKIKKYFYIAMLVIIATIAIVFVALLKNVEEKSKKEVIQNKNFVIGPANDDKIIKFIKGYFNARTELDYPKIFKSFGRDYFKEEREDKDGTFKKIIDSIRYERTFVKGYENVAVYTTDGYYNDDILCIVTYDLSLGFTTDTAPMMIIFYLERVDDDLVIKNNLDVGISKYIVEVANQDIVKEIYKLVYDRLSRILLSNESLRLTYNTLRQYEMNMSQDLGSINKMEIIEEAKIKTTDPVKDAEKIYNEIVEKKEEESVEKRLNDYLEKVIASLSDTQRIAPAS